MAPKKDLLDSLYDIINFLAALREPDEERVWQRVLDKVCVALDAEAGSYFAVFPKKHQVVPKYSVGVPPEKLSQIPIEIGKGICGWVAKYREPALVEDAYQDERFMGDFDAITGFKTRSLLCIPVLDKLEPVAILELINKRGGSFTRSDLEFVSCVASQTAATLRILRLEETVNRVTAHNESILQNLTGGFLAVDLREKIMILNPAARRILEIPGEDAMNRPIGDVLTHIPGLARVVLDALKSKKVERRQELHWTHNGEDRLLGYSTMLIQDTQGSLAGAGVTFQDLTHLKK